MQKLLPRYVDKPWGRTDLPPMFVAGKGGRIGEVWFESPDGRDIPLLVKYIFTSEKLSIQVHPDDEQAKALCAVRRKSGISSIANRAQRWASA